MFDNEIIKVRGLFFKGDFNPHHDHRDRRSKTVEDAVKTMSLVQKIYDDDNKIIKPHYNGRMTV